MTTTVTLNQKELGEAIGLYLAQRGLRVVGEVSVSYYPGDMREASTTTVSANVEAIAVKP